MTSLKQQYIELKAMVHASGWAMCEIETGSLGGMADHPKKRIEITSSPDSEWDSMAIILAHEMGHMWQNIEGVTDSFFEGRWPNKILAGEADAWDRAVFILETVGFTHWDKFNKFRKLCLESYARHACLSNSGYSWFYKMYLKNQESKVYSDAWAVNSWGW